MSDTILAFENASYVQDEDHDCGLENIELGIGPGQLVLVRVPPRSLRVPLADAAQGLVLPGSGRVLFEGRTWRERRGSERIAARASIGRVYEGAEWVSNLDLDENVILPACHHSLRPEQEIVDEGIALAQLFDIHDLPALRRPRVGRLNLRALALVRAFLGQPRLLLLERPLRDGAEFALGEGLATCLRRARERGSAVLWTTASSSVWQDDRFEPSARYEVRGSRLEPAEDSRT